MSIKLPGIGQTISGYKYVVSQDNQRDIFVRKRVPLTPNFL